ncbi:eukaryotic translation initiation factor-like [Bidens hawaiensis]|uniref:eukaryotic translation initiation factor-like n=1 Tax=Bidens hawaiensis TaxID=980011 RepID=UPI00404947B7
MKQPHKLEREWTFWFENKSKPNKQGAAWGNNLRKVYTFQTVEEFWCIPSLVSLIQLAIFNGNTLLWVWFGIQTGATSPPLEMLRKPELETMCLETLMALIGEQFDEADEICGVVAAVRQWQDKLSLWTKNAANEAAQMSIGRKWKEITDVSDKITYNFHDDSTTRTAIGRHNV